MKEIALIGGGGHAKVIIEIIEEAGGRVVFINDTDKTVTDVIGYAVSDAMPPADNAVIISVGSNRIRKRIASEIKNEMATAIHPKANLSSRCKIGEGTVVMAGATINSDALIGKHCIINTNASVDHDCHIGDFVHIAPGVSIAGTVSIGEGTLVGIGSCIIPGINIGKWVTIGAGSVIINDVPDHAVVVGVPGDVIKYNQ
jgi:sugar O-acyltransferase (sialic acid O-acetyltransferase NeuD family)